MIHIINQDRVVNEFLELVKITSLSRKEGRMARVVKEKLQSLGLTVFEDETGEKINGEAGNLIGKLQGYISEGKTCPGPVFLISAHLDTVPPGENIVPLLDDDIIRSSGDTILGADAKAGIAAILEALRVIKEKNIIHPPLAIVLSVAEEKGLLGISKLNKSLFAAEMGIVLDSAGPVGSMVIKGPAKTKIRAVIRGKAAHAGFEPETGVSAIQIAADAVRRMKLGRIDRDTTANIGTINGGIATNIVPEEVVIEGEARSLSPEKLEKQNQAMKDAFYEAAAHFQGKVQVEVRMAYPSIDLPEDAPVVELVKRAGKKIGIKMETISTGGGSDANWFNQYGIPTVNLTTGMQKVHTTEEFIRVVDLVNLSRLIVEIIKTAGEQV